VSIVPSDGEPGRSFRGLSEKRGADQQAALEAGYDSTAEWAIDQLAERLIALEVKVDRLTAVVEGYLEAETVDSGETE
jgi:hypothetical protein